MPELRVHFVSGTRSDEAAAGSAILADAFRRQGHAAWLHECTVGFDLPTLSDTDPDTIYVLRDERRLSDFTLLNHVGSRTAIVVAAERTAASLSAELDLPVHSVTAVDALEIASCEGAPPNAALLGMLARVLPGANVDALAAAVWAAYDTTLPYAAQAAVRAFDRAFALARR